MCILWSAWPKGLTPPPLWLDCPYFKFIHFLLYSVFYEFTPIWLHNIQLAIAETAACKWHCREVRILDSEKGENHCNIFRISGGLQLGDSQCELMWGQWGSTEVIGKVRSDILNVCKPGNITDTEIVFLNFPEFAKFLSNILNFLIFLNFFQPFSNFLGIFFDISTLPKIKIKIKVCSKPIIVHLSKYVNYSYPYKVLKSFPKQGSALYENWFSLLCRQVLMTLRTKEIRIIQRWAVEFVPVCEAKTEALYVLLYNFYWI